MVQAATEGTAIQAAGIRVCFDGHTVLDGVTLSVRPGEIAAVVGASGSGKTTLVNALAGFKPTAAGEVHILGERLDPKDPDQGDQLRREKVGVLAQDLVLLPELTAVRNVAVPLLLAGIAPGLATAAARESLALLGLGDHGDRPSRTLSRGQRQRTALARALAHDRPVLLLDEPTSSLDDATRTTVLEHIRSRAAAGAAVVLTTHDAWVIEQADTVWDLNDGRLSHRGPS